MKVTESAVLENNANVSLLNTKVLHVVNISFVLPYYIGGQFDYFRKRGVKFYVACQPSIHLEEYALQKKFVPVRLNILRRIKIIEDVKAIYKLRNYIKSEGIDVIIGHTPKGGLIGMVAAYLSGRKNRIYFRHGLMFETSKGLKKFLLVGIEKLTGALATKVICVSPSVLQISNDQKLSPSYKNIMLNKGTCNGIDALNTFNPSKIEQLQVQALKSQYGIKQEDRVIGYVGRLVNDKGIKELLNAWELLSARNADVKLLLVGPFEDRDAISEELKAYIKDTPSIIHVGLIHDIKVFYALMEIFILPSYREGFPTVVLEASAMKLPVLTTRATGCIDSIIEDKTGRFVDFDPSDIALHIEGYLNDPALARKHGENGRQFVLNNFEQSVIWQELSHEVLGIRKSC